MTPPLQIQRDVSLAPFTTLGLGGPARSFVEVDSVDGLVRALEWAATRCELLVLGGGSNLVVADAGFPGLVVRLGIRGRREPAPGALEVAAGERWDAVVDHAVAHGWAGVECLAGIPGSTGATPVQNVGAYGQDVADVIQSVGVVDVATAALHTFTGAECEFGYRDSRFKRDPGRWVVHTVTFQLRPGGAPTVAYKELAQALEGQSAPTLAATRAAVLALRRRKSMVLDPADPNARSAGSFFTNPVVDDALADRVVATAVQRGLVAHPQQVPRFAAGPGRSKLAAAWLIEQAGIRRGEGAHGVAVSEKHALVLVHRGGGSTAALLALARRIRDRVAAAFGVELRPEPTIVGEAF